MKAWSEEKALRSGRHVHSLVVKKMIKKDVFVGTSLMDMYAKCGEISDCRKVFDGVSNRNMLEKVFGEGAIANSEALLIGRSIHSIGEKNVKCLCGKCFDSYVCKMWICQYALEELGFMEGHDNMG